MDTFPWCSLVVMLKYCCGSGWYQSHGSKLKNATVVQFMPLVQAYSLGRVKYTLVGKLIDSMRT